jgi:hypothetical protein
MEVLTTPKEGVPENKPTLNATASLQLESRNSRAPN